MWRARCGRHAKSAEFGTQRLETQEAGWKPALPRQENAAPRGTQDGEVKPPLRRQEQRHKKTQEGLGDLGLGGDDVVADGVVD
jgi:hypothetical protein